ncbi:MAG: NAD(P)-dependent alcohol dehydrogenase [Tabrizicola sp.]|uniref:quinone oxidoreductase family protein n=1 Tax=Tabrizicola sp. TaxID=2005166 RepID=UPI002736539A|nr:NAD(P)-dependent alcohol dehydrogenase [Tabrizicola sp.]MDP3263680.1 NAD(P)-dependent alcohol dehydrogenase [Tabrizicola sp.]MDP3647044.1 NAD(P)-dependent alcohol dehydrogenase [Paracoccaceae bacterium]MDZ4066837.1 NAD(P)-dependent alcohol dehydrogenase [Tabrizicola sp.]
MKIARYTAYGGPETIRLEEAPVPVPGPGDVLVRVRAAPVTAGDVRMRSGLVPRGLGLMVRLAIGVLRPRVAPGWAFAGEVAAVGAGITRFAPGQRVFGLTGFKGGAHRDYLVIGEDGPILPLPDTLTFEAGAAFFFGGLTAAEFLIDRAKVRPGERVLVAGATGAVGGAAVQIARHLGARVAATASPANHALARRLGASEVSDYRDGPPAGPFEVIVDVMGQLGWQGARPLLAEGGRLVLITADLAAMLGSALRPRRDGRQMITGTNKDDLPSMLRLVGLHQEGAYTPVVGQVLPFADLAEAHRIAETFHKPGNLVVVMDQTSA